MTVLEALDFQNQTEEDLKGQDIHMNFLEAMVLKQKSNDSNTNWYLKGESIGQLEIVETSNNDDLNESIINIPISDHFEYRKYEDHNNEKRPSQKD